MNNQNYNSGQYGYVNRNGRLVPTNTVNGRQNTSKTVNSSQRTQSTGTVRAKETAGYSANSTPKQQSRPATTQAQQKPQKTYADRVVEKENQKKNKKDKNRGKGVKRLCLTLSLIMILSAAKQMPFNIKTRITELAAKNGTHNYMDDVFASDEKITVVNPKNGKEQKIQLEDAINKLEDYVEICKLIDELKITDADYTELTDIEKKNAKALYEEDGVNGLVELYKDNTANPIEKARTARQLAFIRDYYGGDWIEKNGLSVVTAILEKTIQTAAIENYGTFKPTEYGVVQIPSENEFPYFLVTIKDPVSGATDDVVFTPIAAGEYAQAILLLRNLRETDNSKLTDKERLQKIEHTIRVIKKCLGKEVEDVLGVTYTKQVK